MKTINYLANAEDRVVELAELKKSFEYEGFNLAIVKLNDNRLQLIHFESGGKLPMFMALENKSIKTYYTKSLEALKLLIDRVGMEEFKRVLTDTVKIN